MTKVKTERKARRGFTLIELVVVLLVLAGIAGILVPVFQNMLLRTHGASGASNIAEVTKALQMNLAEYGSYPNRLDSLFDGTDFVEGGFGGDVVAGSTLGATERDTVVDALDEAGIDLIVNSPAATADQTFFTGAGTAPLAAGTNWGILSAAAITELGLQATGGTGNRDPIAYVALGVGGSNTGIGRVMVDAPVHFPEDGDTNPSVTYSRFIAIFAIPNVGGARLATVVAGHDDGLVSLGGHLGEYYESRN